jgi:hypothetical protein
VKSTYSVALLFNLPDYNNETIPLDDVSLDAGNQYYEIFIDVMNFEIMSGNLIEAKKYFEKMAKLLLTKRLKPNEKMLTSMTEIRHKIYSR